MPVGIVLFYALYVLFLVVVATDHERSPSVTRRRKRRQGSS